MAFVGHEAGAASGRIGDAHIEGPRSSSDVAEGYIDYPMLAVVAVVAVLA